MRSDIPTVTMLELDELPRGAVHRLWVQIAHDGLGLPIRVPVLVARGKREGPVFGLTSAIHGNELNGIPLIHRLMHRMDPNQLRGTVVAAVVVNVPGFHAHERRFNDGKDLNHMFPGRADGDTASVYVHRLMDRIVRHFDQMIDLHTASTGRVNSLYVRADMTGERTTRMATLQRPQIIVHNPPADQTLRGCADDLGIPAITLEIGNPQRFHGEYVKRSLTGVRAVLSELGMLPRRQLAHREPAVLCESSFWMYTDAGGLLEVLPKTTDRVQEGEVVARIHDAFGDPVREYRAPADGIVIGKSVDPVAQTGARILHLGLIAKPGDPRFTLDAGASA